MIGFAALALAAMPAMAEERHPGSGGLMPAPRQLPPVAEKVTVPYSTYSDQLAQSLGVQDGRIELTGPQKSGSYVPGVSLGGGSILRLQWRP